MKAVQSLIYGGQVTLIGLVVVFAALAALIVCIWLMSKMIRSFAERSRESDNSLPISDEPAPTPEAAPVSLTEERDDAIDPAIIAAIAAALAVFTDSGKQLVIRSVRRSNSWARAARNEQVGRF